MNETAQDLYANWQRWLATHPDQTWKNDWNDWRIVSWGSETDSLSLTCKYHPELRWETQNLKCIGYKTISFEGNLDDIKRRPRFEEDFSGYMEFEPAALQCRCSMADLFPVVPEYAELLPVNIK
jgi:hypothetical protein